jgi:lysophospholipase L1-like esterase
LRIFHKLLALFVCLATAGCNGFGAGGNSPTAPSGPPAAGSSIRYTALGASDTGGIGSSVECPVPLTACPAGMGYVFVATRQLISLGYSTTLRNLGVPTAVISGRFQALGQQYGRFILGTLLESQMPFVQDDTTVVTIFAGGNEVNVILAAVNAGAGGADANGYIDQQVSLFAGDYQALVDGIRRRASSARIIALNLPNLAGAPYLAGASAIERRGAQRAAVAVTNAINALTSRGVSVIDLMCDPRLYQPASFSGDGFHPNDTGYRIMADEVVRAITSTAYPMPRGACPEMALAD